MKQGDVQYKKMLGGMLVALKRETDSVLQLLQSDKHDSETIARAKKLCKEKLHLQGNPCFTPKGIDANFFAGNATLDSALAFFH